MIYNWLSILLLSILFANASLLTTPPAHIHSIPLYLQLKSLSLQTTQKRRDITSKLVSPQKHHTRYELNCQLLIRQTHQLSTLPKSLSSQQTPLSNDHVAD